MRRALLSFGRGHTLYLDGFPKSGFVLLQFCGPWGDASYESAAALKRTHWVAIRNELIYDINWGSWIPIFAWETIVYPMFRMYEPRITGWEIRSAISVEDHP